MPEGHTATRAMDIVGYQALRCDTPTTFPALAQLLPLTIPATKKCAQAITVSTGKFDVIHAPNRLLGGRSNLAIGVRLYLTAPSKANFKTLAIKIRLPKEVRLSDDNQPWWDNGPNGIFLTLTSKAAAVALDGLAP